jgi:DNA-binding GntR family transcriptional regulator
MNTIIDRLEVGEERRLSRVETAYRKIKARILSNEYPASFQILEPQLAEKLGVSRTPVREALIRLEADKLIELIPRRGMKVVGMTPTCIAEAYSVLFILELEALQTIDSNSAEQISASARSMLTLASERDYIAWFEHSCNVHDQFVANCQNTELKNLTLSLRERLMRAETISLELRSDLADFSERLVAFAESLIAGELEEASRLYREHCSAALQSFQALLDKYKLQAL